MSSRKAALCGMMAALGVVWMLLGGLVPGSTYCAPVLGMLPLLPVLSEWGSRPALGVYAVTAALSLLLLPDKEIAGVYAALGYYPVLRVALNRRISHRVPRVLCKLAVCSGAIGLLYFLLLHLFCLEGLAEEFASFSTWMALILAAMGNLSILLLDIALDRLTLLWQTRLRSRLWPKK